MQKKLCQPHTLHQCQLSSTISNSPYNDMLSIKGPFSVSFAFEYLLLLYSVTLYTTYEKHHSNIFLMSHLGSAYYFYYVAVAGAAITELYTFLAPSHGDCFLFLKYCLVQ